MAAEAGTANVACGLGIASGLPRERQALGVRPLDVPMDEAALVKLSKPNDGADGEAQKRRNLPRPPQEPQQWLSAWVPIQERQPPMMRLQPQGARGPGGSSSFRSASACCSPAGGSGEGCSDEGMAARSRKSFAIPRVPGQDQLPILPKGLRRMSGRSCHGAGLFDVIAPRTRIVQKQSAGGIINLLSLTRNPLASCRFRGQAVKLIRPFVRTQPG